MWILGTSDIQIRIHQFNSCPYLHTSTPPSLGSITTQGSVSQSRVQCRVIRLPGRLCSRGSAHTWGQTGVHHNSWMSYFFFYIFFNLPNWMFFFGCTYQTGCCFCFLLTKLDVLIVYFFYLFFLFTFFNYPSGPTAIMVRGGTVCPHALLQHFIPPRGT